MDSDDVYMEVGTFQLALIVRLIPHGVDVTGWLTNTPLAFLSLVLG